MTRKLAVGAEKTSVPITLLCAVLAILILPVHSNTSPHALQFDSYVQETPTEFALKETVESVTYQDAKPLLQNASDPAHISGTAEGAISSYLFGVAKSESVFENPLISHEPLPNARPSDGEHLFDSPMPSHVTNPAPGLYACHYNPTKIEYQMLLYCVDHETRSGSLDHRILIAQVVMNRVQGPKFGSTIEEILMKDGQFDVMVNWESRDNWLPKEDTVKAVDAVLNGCAPDLAQGAVYFCNPTIVGANNWFDQNLMVVCEIEGHRFYKPY